MLKQPETFLLVFVPSAVVLLNWVLGPFQKEDHENKWHKSKWRTFSCAMLYTPAFNISPPNTIRLDIRNKFTLGRESPLLVGNRFIIQILDPNGISKQLLYVKYFRLFVLLKKTFLIVKNPVDFRIYSHITSFSIIFMCWQITRFIDFQQI